jgi:hypothetical protein
MSEPMEWPTSRAVAKPAASMSAAVQSASAAMDASGAPAERPCPGRSGASTPQPWFANARASSAQTE